MEHVAFPKQPINKFKPAWQSRQQALRPYCSHIYTVMPCNACLATALHAPNELCTLVYTAFDFSSYPFVHPKKGSESNTILE